MASFVVPLFFSFPLSAGAFEADVHFGLTQWLALQADFKPQEAAFIARGDQQADAGKMDAVAPLLEYACLARSPAMSGVAQSYHFASAAKLPAPAEQRSIAANSEVARRKVDAVLAAAKTKADSHLLKLGEALHLLQDSWAYQGVPDQIAFATPAVQCDPALTWATPKARGGWNSHKGDLASQWPEDVEAMAAATYQYLTAYPPLAERRRAARAWPEVREQLAGFLRADSKAAQHRWFAAQGIEDVAFLNGTSLPDGAGFAAPGPLALGRALPQLPGEATTQYSAKPDVKEFFDDFFAQWLMSAKPEAVLGKATTAQQRQLAARLKLWRLQNHGGAAALAHTLQPLSAAQLKAVDALARKPGAYVSYQKLTDAFFPLLEDSPVATPLLPFIIHALPAQEGAQQQGEQQKGVERAIAIVKLRHLPYDELGVIAEKSDGKWHAVDLIAVVSH